MYKRQNIYEKEGSDCWFSDDPQRFLGEKYKSEDYEKLSDIVEVWFDSGSTHSFVLEKREDLKWPASMYLEGSDQHRGWFHSSLLESCGTRGKAPFESILSHGFVVDGKGLKMSKSLGNVIAPEDILKKYGADILRIWVASSNYAEDLRILKISAPYFFKISSGAITFPSDLDIFNPFPSTTKPCDKIDSNGAFPLVPQDSSNDE